MKNDFCTKDGASVIKEKIQQYWQERGFAVNVDMINSGFIPAMRSARTDIRSDMINGVPPRRLNGDHDMRK